MCTLSLPETLLGASLLSGAIGVHSATLLITTKTADYDGQRNRHCSLRDALAGAHQMSATDLLPLPSGTLTRPTLRADDNQPIDEDANPLGEMGERLIKGAGIGKSSVEGLHRDPFAVEHRLLEARPGARLALTVRWPATSAPSN